MDVVKLVKEKKFLLALGVLVVVVVTVVLVKLRGKKSSETSED
jgi:hypothetical protein